MLADRRTTQQQAQLLASRGQFKAAIEEWKKLLTSSPNDGAIYNSIGDLHLKASAPKEAIVAYAQAADTFRSEGSTLKAIAAYKKILKVDPSRYEIYRHLGDLNAERGLLSSAVADYLRLGKFFLKEGKAKEALEVYRTIVKQDPSNFDARQRMAELCLKENLQDEALQTYLQLGRERSAQLRREEAREAYLAVLQIDPQNREAEQFLNMAESGSDAPGHLESGGTSTSVGTSKISAGPDRTSMLGEAVRRMNDGEFIGAEGILSQLLSREPGNPEVCQLLARLHLKRGELAIALNEYQFLAGAAMRADDLDLAESLLQEYLEAQPKSVALLELFGAVHEKRGQQETAAIHYGKALEILLERPDPDMPTLPAELYAKIKELVPNSLLVSQFAPSFGDQAEALAPSTGQHDPSRNQLRAEPLPASPPNDRKSTPAASLEESAHAALSQRELGSKDLESTFPKKEEEFETHFILGKAYKDMGLLHEAIEEFRFSVTSEKWFLDSCLQLAFCLKAQGINKRAIACLEHAVSNPRGEGDTLDMIRYELGLLYEAEGLLDSAVRLFETIPTVQDSAKRIEWIKGGGVKQSAYHAEAPSHSNAPGTSPDPSGKDRKKRRISYL